MRLQKFGNLNLESLDGRICLQTRYCITDAAILINEPLMHTSSTDLHGLPALKFSLPLRTGRSRMLVTDGEDFYGEDLDFKETLT